MKQYPAQVAMVLLLLAPQLSGCALLGSPVPEPAPAPLTPVREFIISRVPGAAGATGIINDPEFGEGIRIVVEQEFLAASGETCRRASLLSPQGDTEMVVMCRTPSGDWQMAPRVWGRGISRMAN